MATQTEDGKSSALLDPLKLLQTDLKDSEEYAVAAMRRLRIVGGAMGPTRVKNELLPFLMEVSDQENDQILVAMSQQLGEFSEVLGGAAQLHLLLPLLEKLASEEECVVRDAAVKSLVKLTPHFPRAEVAPKFVPMLRRLAGGDWFTNRVSACGLFSCCYPLVPEQIQEELRGMFNSLCNDDTPMVRKAAYQHLGEYAEQVPKQCFSTDVLPNLKAMAADESDAMRLLAVEACESLSSKIELNEYMQIIFPFVEALQDDTSWRVRKSFCLRCAALSRNLGESIASKRVLPLFGGLLRDKEAEVRQVAARVMADVCREAKSGVMEFVVPHLEALSTDLVPAVRVAFATSVVGLAEPLGKEMAARVLTPIILQLCKDESSEVRDNVVVNIDLVAEAVGPVGLQNSVLPALLELCKDLKWRVRMAVISKTAMLASRVGAKVYQQRLQAALMAAMSDHVFAIREKACEQAGEIVALFGDKWAAEAFFPAAFVIYDKTTNYLHRMTCLMLIIRCAPSCSPELVQSLFLPLMLQAAVDDVPNVRLMGAKAMKPLLKVVDGSNATKMRAALEKLTKDSDSDAAYFSSEALRAMQAK